jgi:23S rRNA (guanine745-N1)-methyltransferase
VPALTTKRRWGSCRPAAPGAGPLLPATGTEQIEYTTSLTRQDALNLVGMTPSARHLDHADLDGLDFLPDQVTVSVLATAYQAQ